MTVRRSTSNSAGGTLISTTSTSVIPASVTTITRTVTLGSTVTTTSIVTNTATMLVIPVPTTDTTITLGGVILTLTSGGTVINTPMPTWITISNAITPTWTENIIPPSSASTVTFTAPLTSTPTWSSTVPVPPSTRTSGVIVTGPPNSHDRCNLASDIWSLLFGPKIGGCMPIEVGIRFGITPTTLKPPGWTGPWVDPEPLPTEPPGSDPENSSSSSSSTTTSSSACSIPTDGYSLPDPDDPEFDNMRKRSVLPVRNITVAPSRREKLALQGRNVTEDLPQPHGGALRARNVTLNIFRRDNRHIAVHRCNIQLTNTVTVSLGVGPYIRLPSRVSTSLNLGSIPVNSRPGVGGETPQEHVFELNYIDQFFRDSPLSLMSCTWVQNNIFSYTRANGSNLGVSLLNAIDNPQNMVWVDKPMNQAKSNVVSNTAGDPNNPPQKVSVDIIGNFDSDEELIYEVEWFIRNLGAVGSYFDETSDIFKATALQVQNLLAEITPDVVPDTTASIPLVFNNWLAGLISQYPARCTTRGVNAYAYYTRRMQIVAAVQNPPVFPRCFALYTAGANAWNPRSFTYTNLIPTTPTSARCNVPGTSGNVGFVGGGSTVTSIPLYLPQRILGSGSTDFYAMGSGNTIAGSHFRGVDVNTATGLNDPSCAGVWAVLDTTNTANFQLASIALNCAGRTGKFDADFDFVINGQQLKCAGLTAGHPGGVTVTIYCAVSQNNAVACAGPGAVPIQMRFFPN